LSYPLGICSFIQCVQSLILSSTFGLRSSIRCIVCFILPCPPGMCYFILCFFSSLTLFFIRCVIGFIFALYQGCVLLSYVLFCLVHSYCFPSSDVSYTYDVISTGMCSFILCVICFTLSFGLRSFIRYGISFLLSGSPEICFLSCVDYVLFCLFDSECFLPSDLSYASYCHLHL
jgi:hypothetical protein